MGALVRHTSLTRDATVSSFTAAIVSIDEVSTRRSVSTRIALAFVDIWSKNKRM